MDSFLFVVEGQCEVQSPLYGVFSETCTSSLVHNHQASFGVLAGTIKSSVSIAQMFAVFHLSAHITKP